MEIKCGFNKIQSLKEFSKQTPKKLVKFEIKENPENDYRADAVEIAAKLVADRPLCKNDEIYIESAKIKTWAPTYVDFSVKTSKFDSLIENKNIPSQLVELVYDSILTFFSVHNKYL